MSESNKSVHWHYLAGAGFLVFAGYKAYEQNWWDVALYVTAGLAFLTSAVSVQNRWPKYKKALTILSWVLIILAGFVFLYRLQLDFTQ